MQAILGLTFDRPDAGAALLVDGRLVAAVAESRLGARRPHDCAFPEHAIRAVLAAGGVRAPELDAIAIAGDARANRLARLQLALRGPEPARAVRAAIAHDASAAIVARVARADGFGAAAMHARPVHVEHHLALLAGAYYASPFDSTTAALSCDAGGDGLAMMVARCEGNRIRVLRRAWLPHGLGVFRLAADQFLGCGQPGEDALAMALAACGDDRYAPLAERMVMLPPAGPLRLHPEFFALTDAWQSSEVDDAEGLPVFARRCWSPRWIRHLGLPRPRTQPAAQREFDIARSCQARFEAGLLHALAMVHRRIATPKIVTAGSCATNGLANARLLRETPFVRAWQSPAPGDAGRAFGAASWTWHNVAGGATRFPLHHAAWGVVHAPAAVRRAIAGAGLQPVLLERAPLAAAVARLLQAGLVVGWYQGRSEFGAGGLGQRSILGDPGVPGMATRVAVAAGMREHVRVPRVAVPRRAVPVWFEQDVPSPFASCVVRVRDAVRGRLCGATHLDGTCWLQTVERESVPGLHDLLVACDAMTGVPILVNEPFQRLGVLVEGPDEAVQCFVSGRLDALVLDGAVLVKAPYERVLATAVRASAAVDSIT